ncbi:MAG: tetratricopeptide repeat protein [Anaerolineae bacterium]|nr:tetratricopeptide repeat protein [Anaerolineae bacterium]
MDHLSFGQWLKRRRQGLGMTQHDLAQHVGYSVTMIRKVEADERVPSRQLVEALAEQLRITPDERTAFLRFARDELSEDLEDLPGHSATPVPQPALAPRSVLPIPPTAIVGRDTERASLGAMLQGDASRLITLTGPGGVGKTRLALQVAAEGQPAFSHGVHFIPLASVLDPALVESTLAQTLGVSDPSGRRLRDSLIDFLADKRMLLVLDNFEHLTPAAPLIAALLAACPGLKVLVTSRSPLHLRGEQEFPLLPLALNPAIQLFTQRATNARPDFHLTPDTTSVVGAICQRLDCLPLALELAAARVKLFSPPALLTRLEHRLTVLTGGAHDLPTRQQTLCNTIAWSYNLLDEVEKTLFRRLAVFVGGFTLDAAEAVCADDEGPRTKDEGDLRFPLGPTSFVLRRDEILDRVASLADKSLVIQMRNFESAEGEPRFTILETIREFALEQLEANGEADTVRARRLSFFLGLAETAEPRLIEAHHAEWMARLENDLDNIRAALDWAITQGKADLCLRLAASLYEFWFHRHYHEGLTYLMRALRLPDGAPLSRTRAKALSAAGELARQQGDWGAARVIAEESVALWRTLDDKRSLAQALLRASTAIRLQGDYATSLTLTEEAVGLCREVGDRWPLTLALNAWTIALVIQARYPAASDAIAEALALSRSLGDRRLIASSLSHSGHVVLQQGNYAAARALYMESVAMWRELDNRWMLANYLFLRGYIAWVEGDYVQATSVCHESLALWRELRHQQRIANTLNLLGLIARGLGDDEEADRRYRESLDLFRAAAHGPGEAAVLHNLGRLSEAEADSARAMALFGTSLRLNHALGEWRGGAFCLIALGRVAEQVGDSQRAGRLFGAAEALQSAGGPLIIPDDRVEYDFDDKAPAVMLDEPYQAAWMEGRAMTLEQAVAYALEMESPEG